MSESNTVQDTAAAIKGVLDAVPIYPDVIQPAAREVGVGLQKVVHLALEPISGLVWGYEKIKEFVQIKVSERLASVPVEDIGPPKPNVGGPAIEALRYTGHEEELRNLYAGLLASSMTKQKRSQAHPAFVEVIKQLTPDEAVIIRRLASAKNYPTILRSTQKYTTNADDEVAIVPFETIRNNFPRLCRDFPLTDSAMTSAYLDNLLRLQVLELHFEESHCFRDNAFNRLRESYTAVHEQIEMEYEREESLRFTQFGEQFVDVCVRQ